MGLVLGREWGESTAGGLHGQERGVRIEREDGVVLGGKLLPSGKRRGEVLAFPSTLAEFPTGHAYEPLITAPLQLDELSRRGFGKINVGLPGCAVGDLEDAATAPVDAVLVVALADVAPVQNRHRAVRSLAELDAAEPRVVGLQDVGLMLHDQRAANALDGFDVHAPTVEVQRHELVAIRRGPVLALVDHHADVCVPAAEVIRPTPPAVDVVPFLASVPVVVFGLLVDELVDEGIRVLAMHALVVGAVDALPAMPDDRVDEQQLVVLGPVGAPGIRGPVAIGLEDLLHGMVTPEATRGGLSLVLLDARDVDPRGAGNADASVEPTVGPPLQAVREGMPAGGGGAESVEDDLRRTGRLIAVRRDEEQVRRTHRPHAAQATFDAGEHLQVVREDGPLVEDAVMVGVLENRDAVAELQVEAFLAVGVGVVLRDPEATALIPAQCDGLTDVGLGGEERGAEAFRQVHGLEGIRRLEQRDRLRLVVVWLRKRRGP